MSPRIQVVALRELCVRCVSNLLVHCLGSEAPYKDDVLRKYLADGTGEVLQEVLNILLGAETLDASTRFACLRVVLRQDVRRLETGMFPLFYYESILEVLRNQGSGIQHLNLRGIWLRDFPVQLSDLITNLLQLRVLFIPHMADDRVLQTALRCDQLSVLDVSGDCSFTCHGLSALSSKSLRVLSIGMYGKHNICDSCDNNATEVLVGTLIRNLPNLQVLKTYSFVGRPLLRLWREQPGYTTKLKYLHDTGTSREVLDAIVSTCPLLEAAHFNAPAEGVLSKLECLKNLKSLKVSSCNAVELQMYLRKGGRQLHTLKVCVLREGSLDVSDICVACPELRILELYKCPALVCLQLQNYFVALECVEILYCTVSGSLLRFLLMNAPFLRRLLVDDTIRIMDGDVFRLCAECEFATLEELWLSHAGGLTITSVELLMGHCSNLKVLGVLSGWNVSQDDMDLLRAVILSSNTQLTLLT